MEVAHGLGGGQDLPIPASFAIAGGSAALTLSFVVLLFAWRSPRFTTPTTGWVLPDALTALVDSRAFAITLRVIGIVVFGYVVVAATLGPDLLTNPTFGIVYVWLWVGIVPLSLLVGPYFRAVSPIRTFHLLFTRALGGSHEGSVRELPARWGYWPAALAVFAFVWLELVYPEATYLGPVRLWFAVYFAVMLVGSALFGSRWLERADPFEVYSTLVGHLSVVRRLDDGRLTLTMPLRHLAGLKAEPGLVAVVSVLLGSTAFDSFRASSYWVRWSQRATVDVTLVDSALLLGACLLVGVTFSLAVMSTGVDRERAARRRLPGALAHAVVPIVVGYMIAHYLTFLVEVGQQTLIYASDPLGTGANLLGTANWSVDYYFSRHTTLLASIKVAAIVTGHVLGVIAAHDRALSLLPARHRVVGQLPLLVAMTAYTFGGLYLLFGL